jgi:hypothetical protein
MCLLRTHTTGSLNKATHYGPRHVDKNPARDHLPVRYAGAVLLVAFEHIASFGQAFTAAVTGPFKTAHTAVFGECT